VAGGGVGGGYAVGVCGEGAEDEGFALVVVGFDFVRGEA